MAFVKLIIPFLLIPIIYAIYLAIYLVYRLFFHPLAKFPGPKLAAATYCYEAYYDLVLGGQYTFTLKELHAKYGPVIRLNPDELHFNDATYYDEIFNVTNGETEKPYRVANAFGPYPAVTAKIAKDYGTVEYHTHRIRRGALNPFFSKRSILDLTPFLQNTIDKLCERFDVASKTGEPINLKYCFAALTLDIMNEYCFSKDSQTLMKPDFGRKLFDGIDSSLELSLVNIQIPWLIESMNKLLDWIMRIFNPTVPDLFDIRESPAQQVEDIRNQKDIAHVNSGHRTVFHELLQSKLPHAEMLRDRLRDEVFNLVTAGFGTSSYLISNLTYHIAANRSVQQKLLRELKTVMSHPDSRPDLQQLEDLPYLPAVLKEGRRLVHTVSHRIARAFPKKTLMYKGQAIPPGTVVHMTNLLIHENEDVFPDAKSFIPERWLGDTSRLLQRNLVPFSRGSRSCIGINLTWAEIYLIIAKTFRRFDFDVGEVLRERDIDTVRDVMVGGPRSDSKGIIVKVLQHDD